MSRNPKDVPLPAAKFEPATSATVEMTEIDGMEQGAILRLPMRASLAGTESCAPATATCTPLSTPCGTTPTAGGCDPEWGLTGYHAAVYELHAARCREIAGKYAAAIGYDYSWNSRLMAATGSIFSSPLFVISPLSTTAAISDDCYK